MVLDRPRLAGLALIAALAAGAASPALAHHSFAMFDRQKEVTLTGVIKEFQWTNPHSWIEINVQDGSMPGEWSIEGDSPNQLTRSGWNRKVFQPGDKVTMIVNPMKNGSKGGSFVKATLADGRVLGRPGRGVEGNAAPAPAAP